MGTRGIVNNRKGVNQWGGGKGTGAGSNDNMPSVHGSRAESAYRHAEQAEAAYKSGADSYESQEDEGQRIRDREAYARAVNARAEATARKSDPSPAVVQNLAARAASAQQTAGGGGSGTPIALASKGTVPAYKYWVKREGHLTASASSVLTEYVTSQGLDRGTFDRLAGEMGMKDPMYRPKK